MTKAIPMADRLSAAKGATYLTAGVGAAYGVHRLMKKLGLGGKPVGRGMAKVSAAKYCRRVRKGNPVLNLRYGGKAKKIRVALEARHK